MEDLKETDHKSFNEHWLEIEKIVMGCRGVKSREVHWSEAIPMLAAYVVRNTNKQLLKEERNKGMEIAIKRLENEIEGWLFVYPNPQPQSPASYGIDSLNQAIRNIRELDMKSQ